MWRQATRRWGPVVSIVKKSYLHLAAKSHADTCSVPCGSLAMRRSYHYCTRVNIGHPTAAAMEGTRIGGGGEADIAIAASSLQLCVIIWKKWKWVTKDLCCDLCFLCQHKENGLKCNQTCHIAHSFSHMICHRRHSHACKSTHASHHKSLEAYFLRSSSSNYALNETLFFIYLLYHCLPRGYKFTWSFVFRYVAFA